MEMPIIEVNDLVRTYKIAKRDKGFLNYLFSREYTIKKAVDGISLNIDKGEMVGYIGANGSGKSTTIKVLTGILVPTAGEARVFGNIPYNSRKENAKKIGVVFGQRTQLWWDLPVKDSFELLRRIYRIPIPDYNQRLKKYTDILDINSFINFPVRQLSLGQRIRSDLVAAILHNPQILFLDEPTIGLDVTSKNHLRNFIKEMNYENGVTVILTTHDMKDIEQTCQRIVLIDNGKKVLDSSIEKVFDKFSKVRRLIVDFEQVITTENLTNVELPIIDVKKINEYKWELSFSRDVISASMLIEKLSRQFSVKDITVEEQDIEDIVRNIYSGEIVLV
jgi:ABC-2 type transport system ATP-binding protein